MGAQNSAITLMGTSPDVILSKSNKTNFPHSSGDKRRAILWWGTRKVGLSVNCPKW